jgi:hypothetical protein
LPRRTVGWSFGTSVAVTGFPGDLKTTTNIHSTKYQMRKISWFLSLLMILLPIGPVLAGQKTDNLEHVKKSVARLGVGSKARATVTLTNGSKVKGYIYSAADEDFVVRDRQTDAPTTVRYADVKSVDDNRGHRNAKLAVIFVGIGAAITLATVFGAIAANER